MQLLSSRINHPADITVESQTESQTESTTHPHPRATGDFRAQLEAHPDVKVNYDLFDLAESKKKTGFLNGTLTKKELHQLKLLKICNDANVPTFIYDSLLQWAEDAHADGYFGQDQHCFKKREKQVCKQHVSKRT